MSNAMDAATPTTGELIAVACMSWLASVFFSEKEADSKFWDNAGQSAVWIQKIKQLIK